MATLEILPDDVIIGVFHCDVLDSSDVINLGSTCKRFHALATSNSLWKKRFFAKWPSLLFKATKLYEIVDQQSKNEYLFWRNLYQRVNCIFHRLNTIYHSHYFENQLDDEVWDVFLHYSKQFTYEFVHAVLYDIVTDATSVSLTLKYYARRAFNYLQRDYLQLQFENLSLNDKETDRNELSSVMQGLILMEQWFNPVNQYPENTIENFIAETTKKVWECFNSMQSRNPYGDREVNNLKCSAVSHVLFNELEFNRFTRVRFHVDDYCLNKVIQSRSGSNFIISIIYLEIAKRIDLPLKCVARNEILKGFFLRCQGTEFVYQHPGSSTSKTVK